MKNFYFIFMNLSSRHQLENLQDIIRNVERHMNGYKTSYNDAQQLKKRCAWELSRSGWHMHSINRMQPKLVSLYEIHCYINMIVSKRIAKIKTLLANSTVKKGGFTFLG